MSLAGWTLSFLRPYRARVAAIVALSLLEIGLAALAPWPLKAVVDNVLGGQLRFVMPSRLSYHHAGWLYVKDASSSGVTAVSLSKPAHLDFAAAPRRTPGSPGTAGPGRKVT